MGNYTGSTLEIIFENWRVYHEKLRDSIAQLADEHLALQPAPHMWPLGQLVQHIIGVRAGWFSGTLGENDEEMNRYMEWGQRDSPARSPQELARGLDATWAFIEARLRRWTAEEFAETFPDEMYGEPVQVSRSWVAYHVLEHDLHHGGEISQLLGSHRLPAPDL
ncbi:MAG TPA: DinB family protein [Herpetosiphonaceae bacterium]